VHYKSIPSRNNIALPQVVRWSDFGFDNARSGKVVETMADVWIVAKPPMRIPA
jgi:hypothetical protein